MDDKKKIVLGSEDFLSKGNEDIFINLNLQQTFNSIKRDRFDNNFDLAEQFRKERNASRNFRIYGMIDSKIIDCDNLSIKVYSSSNLIGITQTLSNLIYTTTSQSLGFGDKNVFGKMRGKYIIELNNYTLSDHIYIEVQGDGVTYAKTIIEQEIVFVGADGEFVEYGTNTIDIGISGEFVEINNDFPFFYNKHWIKNDFQIEEVKVRNVRFSKSSYTVDEGAEETIFVELSEPSVFGTENVSIELINLDVESYNYAAKDIDYTVDSSPFTFPMNLSWAIGEQVKEIDISALSDFVIEKNEEQFSLSISNLNNVSTDQGSVNISATTVSIVDQTPRVYANYNFQNIVRNIVPLTNTNIFSENLGVIPGYEMNLYGAKDGVGTASNVNNNFRFFPNDTFELTITNEGDSTTLPIIPGFTTQEQFFAAGQSITIPIINKYQNHDNLPKETAIFRFLEKDTGGVFGGGNYYTDFFYINGFKMGQIPLVADDFVEEIIERYSQTNMELPFEITQSVATVTLTANHPANNINGLIPLESAGFGLSNYALQGFSEVPDYQGGRVSSITDQIPFELKLFANTLNATNCKYSFSIKKPRYKDVLIPASNVNASISGNDVYLVTPIKDVAGPTLPVNDAVVCNPFTYALDVDGLYLNGVALLGDNATATNAHTSGYLPSFRNSPLITDINTCNSHIELSKVLS